jgi:hypothetical protein
MRYSTDLTRSAQELAIMSHERELIRATELMQNPENGHLTEDRCAPRLLWNQCHGAPVPGQSDIYIECDSGHLRWRYSRKQCVPAN